MCCGVLLSEIMFLLMYVFTAPALTASSGPHLLLHLYLIYTGYSVLGALLTSLTPFFREVIQVVVCGIVLVCYPLTLVPAPALDVLNYLLLLVTPCMFLLEGVCLSNSIMTTSRFLASNIDDNPGPSKAAILSLSLASVIGSVYINFALLDFHPSTKLLILGLVGLMLVVNIVKDEGVISDACMLALCTYIIIACCQLESVVSTGPSVKLDTSSAQTMLGAIVRIPHLVSYGLSSVLPLAKHLLSPLPLCMLAVRVISVAWTFDRWLEEDSWARSLGKFYIVTMYTSYVLSATFEGDKVLLQGLSMVCRVCEIGLLNGCYLKRLLGDVNLDESY